MAIYRLEARIIGRARGGSAVGSSAYVGRTSVVRMAAYRSGGTLREGPERTYDFTHKTDVEAAFVLAPDDAPDWARDRQALWNRVEATEKRKDAQLAREVLLSLPRELSPEQRRALVTGYVQEHFVKLGMVADVGIHNPPASDGGEQPHAHVLLTLRPLKADGSGFGNKAREWNASFRWRDGQDGQRACHARALGTDGKGSLNLWRQEWQEACNRALADAGSAARVDHRSLAARNIPRQPQPKLGKVKHMRHPPPGPAERLARFHEVNARNRARAQIRALARHPLPTRGAALTMDEPRRPRKRLTPGLGPEIDR